MSGYDIDRDWGDENDFEDYDLDDYDDFYIDTSYEEDEEDWDDFDEEDEDFLGGAFLPRRPLGDGPLMESEAEEERELVLV